MTEQEVEALGARLMRIWEPDEKGLVWDGLDHGFRGYLLVGILFEYWLFPNTFSLVSPQGKERGAIETLDGVVHDWSMFQTEEVASIACEQFAIQWMPFFRRNCWLSGYDIEASAHEKLEWIQGFSHEELEAWNLKI